MYFHESDRLVQQHPDLRVAVEALEDFLHEAGASAAFTAREVSEFCHDIDANQIDAVLEHLTAEGVLQTAAEIACAEQGTRMPSSQIEKPDTRRGPVCGCMTSQRRLDQCSQCVVYRFSERGKTAIGGVASKHTVTTAVDGVHCIYRCLPHDRRASVIFVHGLGAHWEETWMASGGHETWMTWLGEDSKAVDVYAVEYEVAKSAWTGHAMPLSERAKNLLERLALVLRDDVPIVLIGHSMGGLQVKQMFKSAAMPGVPHEWTGLMSRVRAVVFFGTPHQGSSLASLAISLPRLLVRPTEAT